MIPLRLGNTTRKRPRPAHHRNQADRCRHLVSDGNGRFSSGQQMDSLVHRSVTAVVRLRELCGLDGLDVSRSCSSCGLQIMFILTQAKQIRAEWSGLQCETRTASCSGKAPARPSVYPPNFDSSETRSTQPAMTEPATCCCQGGRARSIGCITVTVQLISMLAPRGNSSHAIAHLRTLESVIRPSMTSA